ncbi:MICOS complex subunit mic60 [Mycoemilia scoparia]|uniref:MICOS complex subunit MIC60 n=1 Tax=Mycoemilia scoparia TaxID=417184 RepID=A0A9W7ZX83_9FUNG|nr:MICOS complex subunit mic60 [Mycoemilia scoparia]
MLRAPLGFGTKPIGGMSNALNKGGIYRRYAAAVASPKTAKPTKPKRKIFGKLVGTGIVLGGAFVGGAIYSQHDPIFAENYKSFVPGGKEFLVKVNQHNDSVWFALSDVLFETYDKVEYTSKFIYQQFGSLYNMLRHNTWHPEEVDGPKKETQVDKAPLVPKIASALEKPDSRPLKPASAQEKSTPQIGINIEIPPLETNDPKLKEMSDAIIRLIDALNKGNLSSYNLKPIQTLAYGLVELQNKLNSAVDDQKEAVKAAVDEKTQEFVKAIEDFEASAGKALKLREAELRKEKDQALSSFSNESQKRLLEELEAQKSMLERRFNRFVRARVDEERGGRLAQMDRLVTQYTELVALIREHSRISESFSELGCVSASIDILNSTIMSEPHATPFFDELKALVKSVENLNTTSTEGAYTATEAAFKSIKPKVALSGVSSPNELEDRFDYVRREVRRVSLVPEDGTFVSQVQSAMLSKLLFEKEGLVEGDDTESVLARAHYHLRRHDLDGATRELNQLKSWSKKLAEDWIAEARQRLEVEQALQVARSEDILAKIIRI